MSSLLGQFFTRIKGSQEDIASEGLTYVLKQSDAARNAVYNLLRVNCRLEFEDLRFKSQNTGKNLDRPDITAHNAENQEVLIMETKFWAPMTKNQPLGYLERLGKNTALVFICPGMRLQNVYDECLRRINNADLPNNPVESNYLVAFDDNRFLLVISWDDILKAVRKNLEKTGKVELISDIDQIIGFCEIIDSNAFLPLQSNDLSPLLPRRVINYQNMIDSVVSKLRSKKIASTEGLNAVATKKWYARSFKVGKLGVKIRLDWIRWANNADTPFWIMFRDNTLTNNWSISDEFRQKLSNLAFKLNLTSRQFIPTSPIFPLFPLHHKTEDEVREDLIRQIIDMVNFLSDEKIEMF